MPCACRKKQTVKEQFLHSEYFLTDMLEAVRLSQAGCSGTKHKVEPEGWKAILSIAGVVVGCGVTELAELCH